MLYFYGWHSRCIRGVTKAEIRSMDGKADETLLVG
jgi:hypothetical protein